ncbi:TPA: hypothetical protein ACPZRY_004505 [Yersinia enterocolitica]|uniref:Uncharacterized protein n=1 Tax=Yersinia aleksiciae TaxID=263819 RepID=A0A0T9T2Z7_YERAE|nr:MULTISPECIES: hypothetical protein [Yersinia]EKN3724663.1 hypothetical protein [Yersinia enterocolitica]EKN4808789.1 hypothetical protein [Yersinia enterocolitica]CNE43104.1 Uncharacterised protein [Yersinia mollaretii]CNK58802.1 Uncharacterised protein [Yersinia aleksiciae]CQJ08687.1 Uncharacterised protein [Yersinia mollaretii]
MKEKKENYIPVRLNNRQVTILDVLIKSGKCRSRSDAIQYLINKQQALG